MLRIKAILNCARANEWEQVECFIKSSGLNVCEIRNQFGDTLLHIALSHKASINVVDRLLEYIDINEPNYQGITPLSSFIMSLLHYTPTDQVVYLDFLLDHGANLMQISDVPRACFGWFPYLFAVRDASDALVAIMKQHGASLAPIKKLYANSVLIE